MEEIVDIITTIVQVIIVGIVIFRLFRILRPFERGLIERFGKYNREASPGLNIVIPWVERLIIVDMREQVIDVPPQEVITKDNVNITVDAVIYYEPTDPKKLVYNVGDFITAATKLAQTNLRNVVGDLELDAALTSRENINTQLKLILDEATDKWGTRVVRVEIQRVDPPQDVQDAMNKVMKAERDRRAAVTEAEVKSDEEFQEYAFTVLKKAFGEEFDEEKGQKTVDGILAKADGDYGVAVGILTSSLG